MAESPWPSQIESPILSSSLGHHLFGIAQHNQIRAAIPAGTLGTPRPKILYFKLIFPSIITVASVLLTLKPSNSTPTDEREAELDHFKTAILVLQKPLMCKNIRFALKMMKQARAEAVPA